MHCGNLKHRRDIVALSIPIFLSSEFPPVRASFLREAVVKLLSLIRKGKRSSRCREMLERRSEDIAFGSRAGSYILSPLRTRYTVTPCLFSCSFDSLSHARVRERSRLSRSRVAIITTARDRPRGRAELGLSSNARPRIFLDRADLPYASRLEWGKEVGMGETQKT